VGWFVRSMADNAAARAKKLEEGRRRLAALRGKRGKPPANPAAGAAKPASDLPAPAEADHVAAANADTGTAEPATAAPAAEAQTRDAGRAVPAAVLDAHCVAEESSRVAAARVATAELTTAVSEAKARPGGEPSRAASPPAEAATAKATSTTAAVAAPDAHRVAESSGAAAARPADSATPVCSSGQSGTETAERSAVNRWLDERNKRMRVVLAAALEMEHAIASASCAQANFDPYISGGSSRGAKLHALLRSSHEVVQRLEGAGIEPGTENDETCFPAVSDVLQQLRAANARAKAMELSGSSSANGSEVAPLGVDGGKVLVSSLFARVRCGISPGAPCGISSCCIESCSYRNDKILYEVIARGAWRHKD